MPTIDPNINMNAIPWRRTELRLEDPVEVSRSGDGKVYAAARPNPRWAGTLLTAHLSKLGTAQEYQRWQRTLERLRNEVIGFAMYSDEQSKPSVPFAATALTIGTIRSDRKGFTLLGTDLSAADGLRAGDLVEILVNAANSERYLHIVASDYTYSASNDLMLSPALNLAEVAGSTVIVERPRGNFIITDLTPVTDTSVPNVGSLSVELVSAL